LAEKAFFFLAFVFSYLWSVDKIWEKRTKVEASQ